MILTVFFNYNGTLKFFKNSKDFLAFYSKADFGGVEPWRSREGMFSLSTLINSVAYYTIGPTLAIGQLWSAVFATL